MAQTYMRSTSSFSGVKAAKQQGRSTPDSEALASSDDDNQDHGLSRVKSNPVSTRRQSSSWLHEVRPNRKISTGALPQATNSQPPTPSAEHGGAAPLRTGSISAFPWNAGFFGPASPSFPDQSDSALTFLLDQTKPVRKAVRSQSYSVGQQDDEPGSQSPTSQFPGRPRGVGPTSVRHRPSKPSLLGETPLDTSGLPQLLEDDGDLNSCSNGSDGGVKLATGYWGKPDIVDPSSNTLLRQAAEQNARARHRSSTTGSPSLYNRRKTAGPVRGLSFTEFESAIEEIEDNTENNFDMQHAGYGRRYSEYAAGSHRDPAEEAMMDNSKKPQWSTSVGFIDALDSQSRRHSFADVKSQRTAQNHGELSVAEAENEASVGSALGRHVPLHSQNIQHPLRYFEGNVTQDRVYEEAVELDYRTQTTTNPYAVPEVINRPTRRFYMVAFKCCRADVYFLPENTGLDLAVGDMVVTDADRGVDLGMVTHADVSLVDAKQFKELSSIEHFRWLMMFSRHAGGANKSHIGPDGLLSIAYDPLSAALGTLTNNGTNLPPQYASQLDVELKPRVIRRVASHTDLNVLRDKEGAEAKAKRICQAKVAEHGLTMEILDAEYQLDYKKLTFFYYADHYINFNELVTDLFKVYKTRIWMSAINPASFASAAGISYIPPPSSIGPGAVGPGLGGPPNRRARKLMNSLAEPVGLGYTGAAFPYSDEQPTSRGPGTLQEQARKAHEMGVPLGMVPFTTPGVDALKYQFPMTQAQLQANYQPFDSQLPPMQTSYPQQPYSRTAYGVPPIPGSHPSAARTFPVSPAMGASAFGSSQRTTHPSPAPGTSATASASNPYSQYQMSMGPPSVSMAASNLYSQKQMSMGPPSVSMAASNPYSQNQMSMGPPSASMAASNTYYSGIVSAPPAPAAAAAASPNFLNEAEWLAEFVRLNDIADKKYPPRR